MLRAANASQAPHTGSITGWVHTAAALSDACLAYAQCEEASQHHASRAMCTGSIVGTGLPLAECVSDALDGQDGASLLVSS